ncbi:acylglycerol kinase, mitochondrial-like [Ptychodera flava]|uniref:acylglycerol kinase, mitochondrial-like n=1 Tax=Ptychodera flava TaxID=63121 RepID=UPI00396A4CA7
MGGAALSIIKGWVKPMHVMKIEGEGGKVVFAMNGIQWGQYTDTKERTPKYWYFGPLKHRMAYLLRSLTSWPPLTTAEMTYTAACNGCNKCVEPVIPPKESFWTWLASWFVTPVKEEVKDYSGIFNEECGVWHDMKISTVEFTASTSNISQTSQDAEDIQIQAGPEDITKTDFIKEGWTRIREKSILDVRERSEENHLNSKEFKLTPSEEAQDSSFYIDNEKYEPMPIHVTLLPKKLRFFTSVTANRLHHENLHIPQG